MAKKSSTKTTDKPAPEAGARRSARAYPAEQRELDVQQERLRNAAAMGAKALEPSPAAATPGLYPPPAVISRTPLMAMEALWSNEALVAGISNPSPASVRQAQTAPTNPAAPASASVQVTFVLPAPQAHRVSLSSEFNSWSVDATPMKRREDGHWETTVALAPGRYQYKFIVDGTWIADPRARENVPNPHGTLNSIVEVRA